MVPKKGTGQGGRGDGQRRSTTTNEGKSHEARDKKTQNVPRSPARRSTSSTSKGKK